MSFVRIIHSVPDSAATMQAKLDIDGNATSYSEEAVEALFTSIVDGAQVSYTKVATGVVQATATVTFSSTGPVADETMTIANVTITARASGATTNEFNRSNTPSVDATNLAACVNSSPDLAGIVSASADSAVVTLTAVVPGVMGNGLDLTESMTNTAIVAFASGSDGKQVAKNYGAAS